MGNANHVCHGDDERMRRPYRAVPSVNASRRNKDACGSSCAMVIAKVPAEREAIKAAGPDEEVEEAHATASLPQGLDLAPSSPTSWPPVKIDFLLREHMAILKEVGLELSGWNRGITAEDTLLVVDMQNDLIPGKFVPEGGRVAVPEGEAVIEPIVELIEAFSKNKALVVATRDYHPADHCSFYEQGGPLPSHCVQATPGSFFYPDVGKALHQAYAAPTQVAEGGLPAAPGRVEIAFKGVMENVDSPSAFGYDRAYFQQRIRHCRWEHDADTSSSSTTGAWTGAMALKCSNLVHDINASPDLAALLHKDLRPLHELIPRSGRLVVAGLPLDTNVLDTVVNAAQLGYERIYVVLDACRPQHFSSGEYGSGFFTDPAYIVSEFSKHNIRAVTSSELLRTSGVLGGG